VVHEGVLPAEYDFQTPGKMRGDPTAKMTVLSAAPLTTSAPEITINNEYSDRARGSGFTSKPNRKEREEKTNCVVERSRNN
jgi:hypothetical protein